MNYQKKNKMHYLNVKKNFKLFLKTKWGKQLDVYKKNPQFWINSKISDDLGEHSHDEDEHDDNDDISDNFFDEDEEDEEEVNDEIGGGGGNKIIKSNVDVNEDEDEDEEEEEVDVELEPEDNIAIGLDDNDEDWNKEDDEDNDNENDNNNNSNNDEQPSVNIEGTFDEEELKKMKKRSFWVKQEVVKKKNETNTSK